MPEEPLIIPSRRGRGKPAPKHPGHGIRTEIKGDGRQHHVLGLGHPLPMRGARGAPPAKSAPPAKAAPKKKAPPAKKRR
ncbi:hypothetical protein [Methylogaea oryzae]|nr:hypothetical protein [Methylogaea oryzae]